MEGPFSAQSADLHTLWEVKWARGWMHDWLGDPCKCLKRVTSCGCGGPRGLAWHSLGIASFQLLTCPLVHHVSDTLSDICNLEILCPCVDGGLPRCQGACPFPCAWALGVHVAVGSGAGLASAYPSSLMEDWFLRHGKPLMSPGKAVKEYGVYLYW